MTTAAPARVDTRRVPVRRADLSYASLDEVLADLDRIERARAEGTLRTVGNWSAGQILDHVALLMELSLEGFPPPKFPLALRIAGRGFYWLLRLRVIRGPMRPGIKFPKGATFLAPPEDVSFEQGAERLRRAVERVRSGEKMTQPSPVLGRMRHEDWLNLHLSHASMHMSFVRFD